MTLEARLNLQKGISENKAYSWTTYNSESLLDSYIIQRQAIKNKLTEEEALENYINDMIEKNLEECLDKALEHIFKDFT